MKPLLFGKRVLITGSTGYIGQAITKGVASQGAQVALHYHRNSEAVESLCLSLKKSNRGANPIAFKADISSAYEARQLVDDSWSALGEIDVLINCVGSAIDKPIVFVKPDSISDTLASNLSTVVNICEPMSQRMIQQGSGSIINLSSITGLVGQPMRTLYGASKSAVISYSKALARSTAAHNVRVNCLAPQVVEGGLADKMKGMVKVIMEENTPIKEPCLAQDIVSPTIMLAEDGSKFITGEVINITGGLVTW